MNIKDYLHNSQGPGGHFPHGLSRAPSQGAVLPVVLGVVCVAAVLGVLWLAYNFG
ncbi:hypothetical protein [Acidocella facilis]|uniref:hypothetical protein n=1 Tax=Acidocella facilis TaxID=525 RepID=UPI0012DE776B|nr:hypothetical protein [Acidocella facilis]